MYVSLPAGYSDQSKTFPVLYLLDAQWDFPMVVHFKRNNDGKVVGLDADQQSGEQESAVKTR